MPAQTLALLSAQLSGGAAVSLLDVSHRGVRLETTRHMRPGQTVSIRFTIDEVTVTVNASVVRAAVTRLEPEVVRYETALALTDDCRQLQVALVECRQPPAVAGAVAAAPASPVEDFPLDAGPGAGSGRGWWLVQTPCRPRPAGRH